MKKNILKIFIILFLSTLFSGCGFHLRGYQTIPVQLKKIYIDWANPYDPLVLQLKQIFSSAGIIIEPSASQAPVTMKILNAQFSQQLSVISPNTQVRTYQLKYHVIFELQKTNGKVIYGPVGVTTHSSYTNNQTQILGDNSMLGMQKDNMINEVIGLIFNRLNSQEARRALGQ